MDRVELILNGISGKILDVGCYCGTLHKRILGKFPQENVYGIDTEIKEQNEHYKRAFAENIPFSNNFFDSIVAGELIEHLKEPELFLKEANRLLKKGGTLIITTPNKGSLINIIFHNYEQPNAPLHFSLFNEKELRKLLEKNGFNFKKVHFLPYTKESCDGTRHKSILGIRIWVNKSLPKKLRENILSISKKVTTL
ncbi:MAG: class I SAM-dependent methyltransferase [archaeon]